MAEQPSSTSGKRNKRLPPIRVEEELHTQAAEKAKQYGGLSVVMRTLLRLFVSGEIDEPVRRMAPDERKRPSRRKKK